MFTVAGAPFTPMWRWRCPALECKTALIKENAAALLEAAVRHYNGLHGPLEGQTVLDFDNVESIHGRRYQLTEEAELELKTSRAGSADVESDS